MSKKNFTITTVATAPSPATSGTSLVVATGTGSLFALNEPAIIFPTNNQPLVSNAEIVMVTNISSDTLTITRTQEGTSAREIVAGDMIIQGITAKDWNDLMTLVNGKITAFADPNADRIVFWDDSAGAFAALTASTGLTISGTNMTVRTASATQTGIVELATTAETQTGTDATRAVTPDGLHDMTSLAGAGWIKDEDNMASNDDTKVPTQQSVKAYVDSKGYTWKGEWATATAYAVNDTVEYGGSGYICIVAHTSGTFATDLTDGKWEMFVEGVSADSIASTIHGATAKTTPVDADEFGLIDSAASNVLKKLTWSNIKATLKSYFDSVTTTLTNKTLSSPLFTGTLDGWVSAGETWTYASADDPTFTFTISGDKTSKYSVGMKIKLTQTTVKYFIVTAISYSSPNTTVTVYGGTDYTLANATITNPYYSTMKAPQGFPVSPDKWSVTVTDSSDRNQSNPTTGQKYNISALNITIPIGNWNIYYQFTLYVTRATNGIADVRATLSTTDNSESTNSFTSIFIVRGTTDGQRVDGQGTTTKQLRLVTTSKTPYYTNMWTTASDITAMGILGASVYGSTSIIRATCAYL